MSAFEPGLINDRWPLVLPEFRVSFHSARERWEAGRLAHMVERVEPGMHVVDVGSEHADLSALYRSWGCDVSLIEPSKPYWPCARATFEANGFEPPLAWFVGFASNETDISPEPVSMGTRSWPAIDGPVVADPGFSHLAQQADSIAQITLDDFADQTFLPDAVQIDVEGAEYRVLEGMTNLLTERHLLVWVSVHPPTMLDWYHKTPEDITDLMASFGYGLEMLPQNGEGELLWFFSRQ